VALVRGVYNCRHVGSMRFNEILVPATKCCSIILPIILVTVPFAPILEKHPVLSLALVCTPSTCSQTSTTVDIPADVMNSAVLLVRRQCLRCRHSDQIRARSG
jgi:hypothetical protein